MPGGMVTTLRLSYLYFFSHKLRTMNTRVIALSEPVKPVPVSFSAETRDKVWTFDLRGTGYLKR